MAINKKALPVFGLYLSVCLFASIVLIRTIARNGIAAEAPVAVSPARAGLSCPALVTQLEDDLFAWYVSALKNTDNGMRPEPMPGALREWESARAEGAARCASDPAAAKFGRLLNVRQGLEANRFLLAKRIGDDISALH